MVRRFLYPVSFLVGIIGLYAGLVALEYYWNVPDWQPRWDIITAPILAWVGLMVAFTWFLAGAVKGRTARLVCLAPSIALVVLAAYVTGPEPLKPGILGRESSSSLWYRGGRLAVLCLPAVFCLLRSGRG